MSKKTITDKIDAITGIASAYLSPTPPAPRSVKIELTGRCNFKCLRGDTLVDTIYGPIPIKELAERYKTIPVYTYKDGDVFIADAINICRTGVNRPLVRVSFDDGSHIDCTPDHKFLQFKQLGRIPGTKEFAIEAQYLKEGDRIRAFQEIATTTEDYTYIQAGRRFIRKRSRLVMEYLLGRKLERKEHIHHKDHDKTNDHPNNLEHLISAKEHFAKHPEVSERMRLHNPAINMTPEWREKIGKAVSGKERSLEQRLRYRSAAIKREAVKRGGDSPIYGPRISRISEINHRVVSVTELCEQEDVYCLEVPSTGWFFANHVLVKNCSFCAHNQRLRDVGEMTRPFYERVVKEMHEAGVEELGVFYLGESFLCKWLPEAIKYAKDVGFQYVFLTTNGSVSTPEKLEACFEAGLDSLKFSLNYANEEQFKTIAQVKGALFENIASNVKAAWEIREQGKYECGLFGSYINYDGEQGERIAEYINDLKPYLDEVYSLPLYNQAALVENDDWKFVQGNRGRADNMRDPLPCWSIFTEGHISFDGRLSACCFDHDSRFDMGNLNEMSFMEAWHSEVFKELRRAHMKKDVTGTICEKCVIY